MNWRKEFHNWRFYIGLERIEYVHGYNSKLPDGNHFLMWDYDDVELKTVRSDLLHVQYIYGLPNIYILASGRPNCYHANCFTRCLWHEAKIIVAYAPSVDQKYLAIGILRGFFTLRYSPIDGFEPEVIETLKSDIPEDVNPYELKSFVTYSKRRRR